MFLMGGENVESTSISHLLENREVTDVISAKPIRANDSSYGEELALAA